MSSDGYVVIKLTQASTYYLGFTLSAMFTNPTGTAYQGTYQVFHQAANL